MFEHNWIDWEYGKYKEVCMFEIWIGYVKVENCILNINYWFMIYDLLDINL